MRRILVGVGVSLFVTYASISTGQTPGGAAPAAPAAKGAPAAPAAAAPAAKAAMGKPKYSFEATLLAKANGCMNPVPTLKTQTPTAETFSVACDKRDPVEIKCENGACE